MRAVLFKWGLTIAPLAYMVFIWILSSLPSDAIINTPFSFDHLMKESLHLIEFGILYWLFAFAMCANRRLTEKTNLLIAVVSIAYGGIDEIHQSFVPYRTAAWIDLIKDAIGVLLSWIIVKKYYFHAETSKIKWIFNKLRDTTR
ncbi:VanZ family protein [Metabacillus arenae]|uniref:VanZ family protein n=1 Tax=Metabacillus arenae TaxID=2771434 RepID=A0A926S3R3_9BACI|nr:VanZ family protein [Metabacillus arenae]MBD1383224.1 VanZ family protein [Metabacillus arenae]